MAANFQDRVNTIADDASDLADLAMRTDVDSTYLPVLDQAIVALRRARSAMIARLRMDNSWTAIARDAETPVGTLRRRHDYSLTK